MTTILQLPEEVLLTIFEDFDFEDSRECQEVCRAWYRPAHLKNLQIVELLDPVEIEKFIASIDSNPNPEYLRAVKRIRITNTEYESPPPVQYRLSKQNIVKLFTRFPNLQEIEVHGDLTILDNIDEKLSKALLEACPKLETFQVRREDIFEDELDDTAYYNILFKIRHLLTRLEVCRSREAQRFGSVQDFTASFPRLREVWDRTGTLDSFRKFLPVFEQLPHLERLALNINGNDDINYTDTYLAKHPSIKSTLSNITELELPLASCGISDESLDFLKKYLTGLIVLSINSSFPFHWAGLQQRLFCRNTLDLTLFVKNLTKFRCWIDFQSLSRCLPTIIEKVFSRIPPPHTNKAKRILHLELSQFNDNPEEMATLFIEWWKLKRLIKIALNHQPTFDEIVTDIFNRTTLIQDVDCFILDINRRGRLNSYFRETTMDMYDEILGRMPSLKEVLLDFPLSFVETKLTPDQYMVLPKVEDVTLKATADARFQTLLDGFFYSFPDVKRLNIYYFSGIWKKDMGEFQLELPRYELETLTLDVSTVRRKMKNTVDNNCFVLILDFINNSRQYLYMVSIEDLSFQEMTDLKGLNGLTRGKDYCQVHISINKLQTLKLCLCAIECFDKREDYIRYNNVRGLINQNTIFCEDDQK